MFFYLQILNAILLWKIFFVQLNFCEAYQFFHKHMLSIYADFASYVGMRKGGVWKNFIKSL